MYILSDSSFWILASNGPYTEAITTVFPEMMLIKLNQDENRVEKVINLNLPWENITEPSARDSTLCSHFKARMLFCSVSMAYNDIVSNSRDLNSIQ